MKKVTLKITGGRGDKIAQFYNCGKSGEELYDQASELMSADSGTIQEFIDGHFEDPDVELFVHSLNEDDNSIVVSAEDENGKSVFLDENFKDGITQRGFVLCDPRKWQLDESMGDGLTRRIKALVASQNDAIEEAIAKWSEDNGDGEYDADFGSEYLCDLADDFAGLVLKSPFEDAGFAMSNAPAGKKSPELLFATRCADLYGTGCMGCELMLGDDEKFDPTKLTLLLSDYDGYYCYCKDSVLPVILYGDKFYRLERAAWEIHHESYGFAKKKEGSAYFEFEGEDF